MPLDRNALARLVPHRGAMCLLDSVAHWDDVRIDCRAVSHRDPDNPLRLGGRLPAVVAIEYAAQAMAVHGGLRALPDHVAAPGYLVAVRDAQLHTARLDDITTDLEISATCLAADSTGLVYAFAVSASGHFVAEGRATVALRATVFPSES
jgi:predicted hotdog family 3-hydroxylacyl-ACP dehydratase